MSSTISSGKALDSTNETPTVSIHSKEETERLLARLCKLFSANKTKRIRRYINSQPIRLFNGWFGFDGCPGIGTIWYPQDNTAKYVSEIWEATLQFDDNKLRHGKGKKWFYQQVTDYLMSLESKQIIFGTAEWNFGAETNLLIGHRTISLSIKELPVICSEYVQIEGYFFPADFQWMFSLTHESFCFLASSKEFIAGFKKILPAWRDYILDYDMLGKPECWNH